MRKLNFRTPYKMTKTDVVVIGGGVIGVAIAYNLTKRGIKVILVEKNDLASGTSGACDGCIFLQSKKPGKHLELALQSAQLYKSLNEELDADIGYKKSGGMIIIESEGQLPAMRQFMSQQRCAGLEVELLKMEDALKLEPHLSPALRGATFSPMDAQVDPLNLVFTFAAAVRRNGAQILTQTEVTDIAVKSGRVEGVKTDKGAIATEIVVNAAGVWTPLIGKMVGIELNIIPRRGQILVTEPLPRLVNCIMLCACYIAAKFNPEQKTSPLGVGLVLEQQVDASNLLIGSTREFVGYDRNVTIEGMHEIAQHAKNSLPILKDVHIIRSFAGLRPYTPDGLPILGQLGPEGFIVAAGHEGDGIALAPITGQLIADIITGVCV